MEGKIKGHPINLAILLLMIAFWFLVGQGCASLKNKSKGELATQALVTTQASVVALAGAADEFCSAGILNREQCKMAFDYYKKAKVSYDQAANMLMLALETNEEGFWQNYQQQQAIFLQIYSDFTKFAVEFGIIQGGR